MGSKTAFMGSVEYFTPGDDFDTYLLRITQFLLLNDFKEEAKKKAFLITSIGTECCRKISNLIEPAKIGDKTYDELLETMKAHFTPDKNEIAESYKFYKRCQGPEELIADYVIDLKYLASSCNFGTFLNRALRDAFVLGVYSNDTRRRLLEKSTLTFAEAITIATSAEMTRNDLKTLRPSSSGSNTNTVRDSRRDDWNQGNFNRNRRFGTNSSRSVSRNNNFRNSSRNPGNNNFNSNNSKSNNHFNSNSSNYNRNSNNQGARNNFKCFNCNVVGHFAKDCRKNQNFKRNNVNIVENEMGDLSIHSVNFLEAEPTALLIHVQIEGDETVMEYDPGACVSLMSKKYFENIFSSNKIEVCTKTLNVVTGHNVHVVGKAKVNVFSSYENEWKELELVIVDVEKDFIPLLGRNWLNILYPDWRKDVNQWFKSDNSQVNSVDDMVVSREKLVEEIKRTYPSVFETNLEQPIKKYKATIHIKENVIPMFYKPYTVPFGLRDKVDKEIERLCAEKILVPVRHCKWASPIVVAPKPDGSIRICADCKVTINKYVKTEHYPLPLVDDLLASLANFKVFSVLDMAGAYQQLEVTEDCRELLTINTQRGLFQYTRLPFGVSVSGSLFQEVMDKLLSGLDGVFCYLDDILIGGYDLEDAKRKLNKVMERLKSHNVKVNESKCKFYREKIQYLGFEISALGVHPTSQKVDAISNAPCPKDVSQLQSFLGLINYYGRFIPNLSSELHVLYELLRKDTKFEWTKERNDVFEKCKKLLVSSTFLVHYDPKKPLILSCDASPYGVGAILSHLIDGVERPIFFASGSLSPAERNYSQLHREALAIIFGVRKFHKYLYGLRFTIYSDHQPLREIFNVNKGTPAVAAARLQRWAVLLSSYMYTIEYRKASHMAHADALSRLPLNEDTGDEEYLINSFNETGDIPLISEDIARETQNDEVLKQVYKLVKDGVPNNNMDKILNPELRKYILKMSSLSCEENCLFFGNRLVIPKSATLGVLELLHKDHRGMVRMKALARGSVWWFGIDADIEAFVRSCDVCKLVQSAEKQKEYGEWPTTNFPFERVHIDLFDFQKNEYLVVFDDYSKYVEVKLVNNYNTYNVIGELRILFAQFGLPKNIVSDNGPPFNAHEFKKFWEANGVNVLNSPPYNPESNGTAERGVETAKNSFKKFMLDSKNERKTKKFMIDNFLMNYRNTPCTVTKCSPSDLIFKYKPRTLLDLLLPENVILKNKNDLSNDEINQNIKNQNFSKKGKKSNPSDYPRKEFQASQKILYLNHFKDMVRWIPGYVLKKLSNYRYLVCINGNTKVAHINQLKNNFDRRVYFQPFVTYASDTTSDDTVNNKQNDNVEITPILRRSTRVTKVPSRYMD